MNRHDYFRMLTKGIKFTGNDNKDVLQRFGYFKKKKEMIEEEKIEHVPEDYIEEEQSNEDDDENLQEINKKRKKKPEKVRSKEKLTLIRQEQINSIRNANKIHAHGTDLPPPVVSLEELQSQYNVNERLVENLKKEGFDAPTPVQMQTWSLMLKRREILVSAPTGSGKTAAFLVPVIHSLKSHRTQGFRAVILAPTRELAKQIVRECDRLSFGTGIRTNIIDKVKNENFLNFVKRFDILVTTPNRLVYIIQESQIINDVLSKIEWLVVDESDRLYEEGKNGFRDQLAIIYKACYGPNVVRAMFSATFDYHVEQWCKLNLNEPVTVSIGIRNTSCSDVDQELVFCGSDRGKIIALREIIRQGYEPPVLIFVQTKERARQLYKELLLDDVRVACIHSDNTQIQRDSIVQSFRERKIWLLICTELMGRGIDFIGINMVINYDFPPSVVSYIHRVGRTGRAGRNGIAKTFWTMEDRTLLRSIAHIIKDSGSEVPDFLLNLKKENKNKMKTFAKNLPERGFISDEAKREKLWKERKKKMKNRGKKTEDENQNQKMETENNKGGIKRKRKEQNSKFEKKIKTDKKKKIKKEKKEN